MSSIGEGGTGLGEVRARNALRSAGLDPHVSLERASSVTNEVWLTADHAVRVNRRRDRRLAREAIVAASLPSVIGYPEIVGKANGPGEDWLVSRRRPGWPLAHRWPALSVEQRRSAIGQVASRLAALHSTAPPAGLPPIDDAPQLLATDPAGIVISGLRDAARLEGVDRMFLHDAIELVQDIGPSVRPFTSQTLIHGDLTFENILWDDGVTALLDVEWSRPGPPDLDLDIILRCCAYPHLHVAEAHVAATRAVDYADVPAWLAEEYPALFDVPRLLDRLRLYAIAYEVRALLDAPPLTRAADLPPLHPYNRLAMIVRGESHLDTLLPRLL